MRPTDEEIKLAARRHINDKHPGVQDGFVVGAKWLRDQPRFSEGEFGDLQSVRHFVDLMMPVGIERDDCLMRLDALLES